MAVILITGGTGMIGKRLTEHLVAEGHEVVIFTRKLPDRKPVKNGIRYALWNIEQQTIDEATIRRANHIIHLAGAGVADKRWSEQRKQEIVDSRTQSSALIVKALSEIPNHVQSVISASAIGWYGPDTTESRKNGFSEDAKPDNAFLGETCRLWEESIEPVTSLGKRLVKLRTGIVLSTQNGALVEFMKPLHMRVATVLGTGKQVVSWIHVDDLCRMYLFAIDHPTISGAYNAVSPSPVTNQELIRILAKQMCGRWYITMYVPSLVLKIVLGEMSIEVLKSATVSCRKIEGERFIFLYPQLVNALEELLGK